MPHAAVLDPKEISEEMAAFATVTPEQASRLHSYVQLLIKWNPSINLVSGDSLEEVWKRHIFDCAQLLSLIPEQSRVVTDIGSGAGLPGLVLAILGDFEVHLIESDGRKAAFLQEAIRVTGAGNVTVHNARAEELPPWPSDVVTARALASLAELLPLAAPFMRHDSVGIFPKGKTAGDECDSAAEQWRFDLEMMKSNTDEESSILRITNLEYNP